MNNEMKKIMGKFCFVSVVICCITAFCVGTVTAKQRSDYNIFYKQYPVFSMKTTEKKIEMTIDERKITFDIEKLKIPKQYERFIYYTPLSCIAFFIQSVSDLIEGENS